MLTNVLNTKNNKVENKIPNHDKYITTPEFNKLTVEGFAARLKQANLTTKTDFVNKLIRYTRRITSNKTKHLEVQKKLNSVTTNDFNFFLSRNYFARNDGSQSTFVYQPTLDTLELTKGTDYAISWKSKGVFISKLRPLFTVFEYQIGIEFYKDPLAVEQNNYLAKIANVYIVNSLSNLKFKYISVSVAEKFQI